MNLKEFANNGKKIKISKEFYSKLTDKPFDKCTFCDKELLESNEDYLIEKVIKQYKSLGSEDVLVEYAICLDCVEESMKTLSDESRQYIEKFFFEEHVIDGSNFTKMMSENFNIEQWTEKCVFTGNLKKDLEEYNLIAQCRGDDLIFMVTPYIIDGRIFEKLFSNLSEKTKKDYGRFMDKVTDPPPEFKEILKDRPLILI